MWGSSSIVGLFVHDNNVDVLYAPSEHSGVQCKTSAVVESCSQVQKSLHLPKGESVPDFEEKLRPITAQEGEVNRTLKFQGMPLSSPNISLHIAFINNCGPLRQWESYKANFRSLPTVCLETPDDTSWTPLGSKGLLLFVNFRQPFAFLDKGTVNTLYLTKLKDSDRVCMMLMTSTVKKQNNRCFFCWILMPVLHKL